MPSADFCAAVRPPCGDLSLESETQRRSPEVRSTAFPARPPDLPPRSLMTVDFAITCSLVRPGRPRYPVLVHRAAALLRASFRLRLATTPLRFANPSPPSGWIEDFHLQAVVHARHTKRRADPKVRPRCSNPGDWYRPDSARVNNPFQERRHWAKHRRSPLLWRQLLGPGPQSSFRFRRDPHLL